MNQNKRKFKGVLSGFMATALTASFLPLPEAQAKNSSFYDVNSYDWYATSVERWSAAGIIHGTGDNLFSPDANVTRGQIAVMINNVMGYEVESQALFSDLLDPSQYYYTPLRYLAAAGVMDGRTDGSMGAEDDVKREEAALMLCQAFHLQMSDATSTSFADNYAISSYAVSSVVTLNEMGVLNGTPDNLVMPGGNLTRAEFATMLNALIKNLTYSGGTSSNPAAIQGTTIVNTASTIENTSINGDVILAPGISYGDVYLDDLSISGNIYVKGGGVDSIYVNDVDVLGEMVVGRDKDPVRVVFTGSSTLSTMKIQDNSIIDATALTSDGKVSDITIQGGENVEIIGTFDSLTNETPGVSLTIDGSIAEIVMNAGGTINGVDVAAGTSFDSNSIPGLDVEEPEITLTHNYGTATEEEDNDPYAESEVMTIDFDATTGKVVATIRVEDEEDCVLMSENHNAITVYNPNDLASLNALELTVERTEYPSYTEFKVSFTMTQNYNEVPLSVNFKDKYAAPEVNIIMNFNDLPKAEAVYEITELDYNTSSETASGVITLTDIKYCEPHYSEKYVLTFDEELHEDLGFATTDIDYDADESTAEISFAFNGAAVDTIDLTVNMLKTDAADEIPTVKSYFYHDDDAAYESKIIYDYAELNAQGLMEVKIDLSLDSEWQLVTGSKAITIDADSGETEYGYGMDFDYELTHEGSISHYIITFAPNTTVEEVTFLVHVEDLDENIPVMSLDISEPRFTATNYAEINMNTRAYSRSNVTVEVAVDEEKIEEITGFELSNDVFVLYVETDSEMTEVASYSVTKLEDGLYQIKFEPETITDNSSDTVSMKETFLVLDFEQTDDYISLYPVTYISDTHDQDTTPSVPLGNLAYAVKADTSGKTITVGGTATNFDYSASVSFTSTTDLSGYNTAGFGFDAEDDVSHELNSYIGLRLDPTYEDENGEDVEDSWDNYLESMYYASVSSVQLTEKDTAGNFLYRNTVVIYFESKPRVDPEDIRLNVKGVSTEANSGTTAEAVYNKPTVSLVGDNSGIVLTTQAPSNTGEVTVSLTGLDTDKYDYTFEEVVASGGKTNLTTDAITFTPGESTTGHFTFTLAGDWKVTDGSNAVIYFNVTATEKDPLPEFTFSGHSVAASSTSNTIKSSVTVSCDTDSLAKGTSTDQYTVDVTISDSANTGYTLSSIGSETADVSGVSWVLKSGETDVYTVTFTVSSTFDVATNIAFDVEMDLPTPTTSNLNLGEGFVFGTDTSANTISRNSQNLSPITWELTSYTSASVYELTTQDAGLELSKTADNSIGDGFFWWDGDPEAASSPTGSFSPTTQNTTVTLDELLETQTIYVSYNFNGENALKLEINVDVETEDIFMLSEDGLDFFEADAGGNQWIPYKAAVEVMGFEYFTFEDRTHLNDSITFNNGETLVFYDGTTVTTDEGKTIRLGEPTETNWTYLKVVDGDLVGLYKNVKTGSVLGFSTDVNHVEDTVNALSTAKILRQLEKDPPLLEKVTTTP